MDYLTNSIKINSNLLRELQKYGFSVSVLKVKRVGYLQDLEMLNNVATVESLRKEIVKGLIGKPKILLHILCERIFVDTNIETRSYYTLGGRNN